MQKIAVAVVTPPRRGLVTKAQLGAYDQQKSFHALFIVQHRTSHSNINLLVLHKYISDPETTISLPHVILFVSTWLRMVLGVEQLRDRGIVNKEIKNQSASACSQLQDGHREARLQFSAKRSSSTSAGAKIVVIVIVTLASILAIMKFPVKSTIAHTCCDNMVKTGIQYQEIEAPPSSEKLFQRSFAPVVSDRNAKCFVLPFKSDNQSLLSADQCSADLSSRLIKLVSNQDESLSGYFENSLKDSIGGKYLTIHGMDLDTLRPQQCLNDAVLNFWFKWVTTPRSPQDTSSQVYVCSTYFLPGVLAEGYNSRYQKWLKKVNLFEKKLVIFPVHLGHHWSLVAVINPGLIKQTKARWGDTSYTGDVTAMIHLDSLGSSSVHDKEQLGSAVRDVLNKEWDRHNNDALDKTDRPFTHRQSFKILFPRGKFCHVTCKQQCLSVPLQTHVIFDALVLILQCQRRVTITIAASTFAATYSTWFRWSTPTLSLV